MFHSTVVFNVDFLFSPFWIHLEYCTRLLRRVKSPDMVAKSFIALKLLATTHLSLRGWAETVQDVQKEMTNPFSKVQEKGVADEMCEGVLLSSALIYLWEGVIPLVTAFCSSFMRLKTFGSHSELYSKLLEDNRHYLESFQSEVVG